MNPKKKLTAIAQGWKNYAFVDKAVEVLAKERAEVCSKCVYAKHSEFVEFIDNKPETQKGMVCDLCSCPLSRQTRQSIIICGKWKR